MQRFIHYVCDPHRMRRKCNVTVGVVSVSRRRHRYLNSKSREDCKLNLNKISSINKAIRDQEMNKLVNIV